MSSITKNQHYVSQCITREFANEKEKLFEALLDFQKVIATNCRNSMAESFTYEHSALKSNTLEHFFGRYETEMGVVLIELKEKLLEYEKGKNNLNEIQALARKHMKKFILFYYKSGALLHEYQFELKDKEDRITYLLQRISDSRYLNKLSETLSNYYQFAVIKSREKEFLLSDQFLSTAALSIKGMFINASNRNIGLKDIVVLIPVSSEYYLVYYDGKVPFNIVKQEFNELTKEQINVVNNVIINNSYKKTIGYKREPLELALQQFIYKSPVGTIAGWNSGSSYRATLKKEVFFTNDIDELWDIFKGPQWSKHFKKIERNDTCFCESGKKLKNCCIEKVALLRDTMRTALSVRDGNRHLITVHPNAIVEKAVVEFGYNKGRG